MGTLFASLLALGGVGGLGWWLATRESTPQSSRASSAPPRLPGPAEPLALPAPRAPAAEPVTAERVEDVRAPRRRPAARRSTRAVPQVASIAPSDFVQRLRGWLQERPPATQVELVASHLERAGHRETATQLRAWAREQRDDNARMEAPPARASARPPVPASSQPAPAGSPDSSSDRGLAELPSGADNDGAQLDSGREARLRTFARDVAEMLREREGRATDRRLVRSFQMAARLFPEHEEPSGLYGPVTREALARYGVTDPPRARFRPQVERGPRRRAAGQRTNTPAENAGGADAPASNAEQPSSRSSNTPT